MSNCHCGTAKTFEACCQPIINKQIMATSAEILMRSRYSAYCIQATDYLVQTTHPSTRKNHHPEDILEWSKANHWVKLEVLFASQNVVEFKAYYLDPSLTPIVHHEKSNFIKEGNQWYYVDGIFF